MIAPNRFSQVVWVKWLQREAAYLYSMADHNRNGGGSANLWIAANVQERAAHTARLAREQFEVLQEEFAS